MYRILFVDDEPKILTGLRRMLRSMRHQWDMEFAEGAFKALELLKSQAFDVVVSDARMPGMEGSELLERVRCEYPDTVRMILSGQCGRNSVLRCIGATHQFLSKPCDAETLKAAIENVCRLRQCVGDAAARAAVSRIDSLPSRASAYTELVDQVETETTPLRQMAETIRSDVAMSMKVVQLVSSGFFGTPQHTIEVDRAAELLGADTLRAMVADTNAFRLPLPDEIDAELVGRISDHSLAVASAARRIAESVTSDCHVIVQSYLAGLFHAVGTLVPVVSAAGGPAAGVAGPEQQTPGAETCGIRAGGYLAALWGLPLEVADAIGSYRCPGQAERHEFTALTALHVAGALLDRCIGLPEADRYEVDRDYLTRINLADRLDQWREICSATQLNEVLP